MYAIATIPLFLSTGCEPKTDTVQEYTQSVERAAARRARTMNIPYEVLTDGDGKLNQTEAKIAGMDEVRRGYRPDRSKGVNVDGFRSLELPPEISDTIKSIADLYAPSLERAISQGRNVKNVDETVQKNANEFVKEYILALLTEGYNETESNF